jgi:hypothetical protein
MSLLAFFASAGLALPFERQPGLEVGVFALMNGRQYLGNIACLLFFPKVWRYGCVVAAALAQAPKSKSLVR